MIVKEKALAAASSDGTLPEGWCHTNLGSVSQLVSGAGFPLNLQGKLGGDYPFFKVGSLRDVTSAEELKQSPDTIDIKTTKQLRAAIIPPNSIVFAKIGMAIRLNRRRRVGVPCCIDNNMMAAVPTAAVLPHYLLRFLETVDLMDLAQATTVPSIRKGELEQVAVWLPPLPEQGRIIKRTEQLLASVNSAHDCLKRARLILKRYRQAVLAAACSGRLTEDWRQTTTENGTGLDLLNQIVHDQEECKRNRSGESTECAVQPDNERNGIPESWVWVSVEKILRNPNHLSYGILKPGRNDPDGIPMLRVMDIGEWDFNDTEVMRVEPRIAAQYQRTKLEIGDILLAVMATIGRVAVVPSQYEGANVNRALAVLKVNRRINPHFVCAILRSPFFQNVFSTEKLGSAQSRINISDLRTFSFPLPPVQEQNEIVNRIEMLFSVARQVEQHVTKSVWRANKLTQSILAKAFRGELVPTEAELARREGRDYEPASVLLERIRQEQELNASTNLKTNHRERKQLAARR